MGASGTAAGSSAVCISTLLKRLLSSASLHSSCFCESTFMRSTSASTGTFGWGEPEAVVDEIQNMSYVHMDKLSYLCLRVCLATPLLLAPYMEMSVGIDALPPIFCTLLLYNWWLLWSRTLLLLFIVISLRTAFCCCGICCCNGGSGWFVDNCCCVAGNSAGAVFNFGLDRPSSFCVRPQENTKEDSEWKCESRTMACTTSDSDQLFLPFVRPFGRITIKLHWELLRGIPSSAWFQLTSMCSLRRSHGRWASILFMSYMARNFDGICSKPLSHSALPPWLMNFFSYIFTRYGHWCRAAA